MRLAGWDKDNIADANIEAFLQQAGDYREMINGSAWNKTLEFMVLKDATHPLMAVRATECGQWADSDLFNRILNGIPDPVEAKPEAPEPKEQNASPAGPDAATELRWYKKMLDEGLITKEQYEQKKNELEK